MSASLEERVERLERLLSASPQNTTVEEVVRRTVEREAPDGDGLDIGPWLQARRKPGQTISAVAVLKGDGVGTSVAAWDPEEEGVWEEEVLRRLASVCGALASDVRLLVLRELTLGPKSTAELLARVSIDRGQLYHHLRDLFVEGFVEQPSRGRYAATSRGEYVLLVAGHLAAIGPETRREVSELEFGDEASA